MSKCLIISLIFIIMCVNKVCFCGLLKGMIDVRGNNGIREVRILYTEDRDERGGYLLKRDRPVFAEVDFVPKYIPQLTYYMAVSVMMPKQIRSSGSGGPWVLGWHQEKFDIPSCRLCTNTNQSYTIPVTLYLPDDGWCPQGPVPTGWKVEALPRSLGVYDNTDMIIGMSIDENAKISIVHSDKNMYCQNSKEYINYTIPFKDHFGDQ